MDKEIKCEMLRIATCRTSLKQSAKQKEIRCLSWQMSYFLAFYLLKYQQHACATHCVTEASVKTS